jgi:hypothetical protein
MDVTVFIRSVNEEAHLERCLKAISQQRTRRSFEIVLFDCSSGGKSLQIARSFGATIYTAPKKLATRASALNAGAQLARGTFLVSLSAHAIPADDEWLENLTAPLVSTPTLMASFSRQFAAEDATVLEREHLESEYGFAAWQRDRANFTQMIREGMEPFGLLTFSNRSACLRRDFLLSHPFYEMPRFEDRAFVLDVLSANLSFAYCPESAVLHSHAPSLSTAMSLAEAAALGRAAVNREACRRFNISNAENFVPLEKKLRRCLPRQSVTAVWRASCALVTAKGAQRAREALFHLTTVADTIGQLRAVKKIAASHVPTVLKRADPTALLMQTRRDAANQAIPASTPPP